MAVHLPPVDGQLSLLSRRSCCAGIAAALAAPCVTRAADDEVVVAQVGPFTGLGVPDALNLNQGIKAGLAQLNSAGGVKGRRLRLIEVDDGYTANGAGFVRAYRESVQRKAVALLSPLGSVAIKRMLDEKLLDRSELIVLNTVPGAEALREPGHPLLFHARAGDRQQIEKIIQHARTVAIHRLAVLHQNIPMGDSGLAVAAHAAQEYSGLQVLAVQSASDLDSVTQAALRVAKEQVQGVLLVGSPVFSADAANALRKSGFWSFIFALTDTSAGLLFKVAGAASYGVGITQVVPNPNRVILPLQRAFRSAMQATYPDARQYSSLNLEGYVTARIFGEAARQATDLSAQGLARSLQRLGEVDLGGLRVNFATSNAGGSFVDIGVVGVDGRLTF